MPNVSGLVCRWTSAAAAAVAAGLPSLEYEFGSRGECARSLSMTQPTATAEKMDGSNLQRVVYPMGCFTAGLQQLGAILAQVARDVAYLRPRRFLLRREFPM